MLAVIAASITWVIRPYATNSKNTTKSGDSLKVDPKCFHPLVPGMLTSTKYGWFVAVDDNEDRIPTENGITPKCTFFEGPHMVINNQQTCDWPYVIIGTSDEIIATVREMKRFLSANQWTFDSFGSTSSRQSFKNVFNEYTVECTKADFAYIELYKGWYTQLVSYLGEMNKQKEKSASPSKDPSDEKLIDVHHL